MSLPRIISTVVFQGTRIVGTAFVQAYRQAARNARASAPAGESATGNGAADAKSRMHGMTLDEAADILNIKRNAFAEETELQKMLKNFDHLFKVNAPLNAEGKPHSSHYLQSKIVRAKERIEAELGKKPDAAGEAAAAEGSAAGAGEAAAGEAPKEPPKA